MLKEHVQKSQISTKVTIKNSKVKKKYKSYKKNSTVKKKCKSHKKNTKVTIKKQKVARKVEKEK